MKSGLMLGVNPSAERQAEDFYATDPKALEIFLDKLESDGIGLNGLEIWEPACGQGHLSDVLKKRGYNVFSTDIVNRGYQDRIVDFLDEYFYDNYGLKKTFSGDILTNPPFKLAEKFVESGINKLENKNRLFLFLKIQFLESQKRKVLFKKYPPKYVYIYSSRQRCAMNGEFEKYGSPTQQYAWYVWEKGFSGETTLRWI